MKQIIWSSDALLDETAREYYQNFKREELDDDAYKVSDEEWSDEVYNELGDERKNLNKDVNGVIIAFGDLGLWNGRKQGYQILGDNIAGILQSTQYDAEWYGDGYDIRGRMSHHDGTNYVLYRVAENRDDAEQIAAKIYNSSNPQPIGFSGILLAKRQNSFYCTYFLHNRNVADTKSPYPIKRLEVIRWFNQKSMVFNQSLS